MVQSLANILIHLIFSTQSRRPFIHPKIAPQLYAYMVGSARQYNVTVYEIGGIEDHIHILFSLPRTLSLSKCVEEIKSYPGRCPGLSLSQPFRLKNSSARRAETVLAQGNALGQSVKKDLQPVGLRQELGAYKPEETTWIC